jgi:hypothetical protein
MSSKEKSREKKKDKLQEALHLGKRKIKLMEETLMKRSQADEDYMCLMSLILSIKKLDNVQRLELRISEQRIQENSNF